METEIILVYKGYEGKSSLCQYNETGYMADTFLTALV